MTDQPAIHPSRPRTCDATLWYRGVLVGIWAICCLVLTVSLIPAIGPALGNLPGDFEVGTIGSSARLPFSTAIVVTVVVTGVYFAVSNYLSRRCSNRR